jgi:hypothetical protein
VNEREWGYLSTTERTWRDVSGLPFSYLLKCAWLKVRRRLYGWYTDRHARFVWTPYAIAEADEPQLVARTYQEHAVVRQLLRDLPPFLRACELGSGYGRMLWVLTEFAHVVVGYERERHLVAEARRRLPSSTMIPVDNLAAVPVPHSTPFDVESHDDDMQPFVRIAAVPRPADADHGGPTGTCMLYRAG